MKVVKVHTKGGDEFFIPLEAPPGTPPFLPNIRDATAVELVEMTEAEYYAEPVDKEVFRD